MRALPDILHEEKYKDMWEFEGGKLKAKPEAPQELKDAISAYIAEATPDEDEDKIVFD
jgi:hypothetical protein